MKKRFSAWVLALAMLCTVMPIAAAAPEDDTAVIGGVGSITALASHESDHISVITRDEVPAGAEILEVTEASAMTRQSLSNAKAPADEMETMQVNYSAQTEQSQAGEYVCSDFTTYGEQLPELVYVYETNNGKSYIYAGKMMKKIYDNVMADLAKGYNSVIFKNTTGNSGDMNAFFNNRSVQNLGRTVTMPKGFTDEVYDDLMREMSWILYRCVDFDSTDMFFSNGYAYYAYIRNGNSCKMWVAPLCYKQYETLTERRNLKQQMDAQVNEIVKQAAAYPLAYDKIRFIHDWLCLHNEYNYDAMNNSRYGIDVSGGPWSSTGAILSHTGVVVSPVCESYSRAFQLICKKAGIQAAVITSDNGPDKDTHMWSNVRYGAYWSGVDVTWDDGSGSDYNYEYFMIPVNGMQGHTMDDPSFSTWMPYPQLSAISDSSILPYYDVPIGFWGTPYVQYVYDHQYMSGMSSVIFGTHNAVTRAQFATILYSLAGKPETYYEPLYKDVPQGQWYTNAIMWANQEDIATGYASGNFGVNDPISREQIALMLYKYADGTPVGVDHLVAFPDVEEVDDWAYEGLNWAVSSEIIGGNADGTLAPQGKAVRVQCAVMITKLAQQAA